MRITRGTVPTFEYAVTDDRGNLIDSSKSSGPLSYIHGRGTIVPGLELALEGRNEGDSFSVTVPPWQGYGERDESLIHVFTKQELTGLGEIKVGMQLQTQEGLKKRILTVSKIEGDEVILDENHPLAGKTVTFNVMVLAVRDATPEELEAGRAYNVVCREDCSTCSAHEHGDDGHDCGCGCDHH
ncbi:MAG: peptidylprolyl isomerase [Chloroflexi bacterium]|nr:peptidylprolyl isomerase [Chloroflexota bacterium]